MDLGSSFATWLQNFVTEDIPVWEIPFFLAVQFFAAFFIARGANFGRSPRHKRLIIYALKMLVPAIFLALVCVVLKLWIRDQSITRGDVLPATSVAIGFSMFLEWLEMSNALSRFHAECARVDFYRGICKGLKHTSIGLLIVGVAFFVGIHCVGESRLPFWANALNVAFNAWLLLAGFNLVWVTGAASIKIHELTIAKPNCSCATQSTTCC